MLTERASIASSAGAVAGLVTLPLGLVAGIVCVTASPLTCLPKVKKTGYKDAVKRNAAIGFKLIHSSLHAPFTFSARSRQDVISKHYIKYENPITHFVDLNLLHVTDHRDDIPGLGTALLAFGKNWITTHFLQMQNEHLKQIKWRIGNGQPVDAFVFFNTIQESFYNMLNNHIVASKVNKLSEYDRTVYLSYGKWIGYCCEAGIFFDLRHEDHVYQLITAPVDDYQVQALDEPLTLMREGIEGFQVSFEMLRMKLARNFDSYKKLENVFSKIIYLD